MVRFDKEDAAERALISINLAPAFRGQRLSAPCLFASVDYLRMHWPNVGEIIDQIKEANVASQKAFEAVGFTLQSRVGGLNVYALNV